MPVYEITSPDGKTFEVTAPAGATQDQVIAYAKGQWQAMQKATQQAEDPGVGKSLLIGAGRTFDRIGKGMQQLYYGATGNQAAQDDLAKRAAEEDKAYQGLKDIRPWATGIGEAAPSMVLPAGGAATLLGNAGRMAAAGAVPGLLEYGDAGDRLKRGAIGAAAGAAFPVAGAAVKTVKSLAEPLYNSGREAIIARTMNRVAGDNAGAVAQRMAQAGELVPGSAPTAAQVAESGGIAALERAAAAANPEAYAQRGMEQANARLNALRAIAGTPAARAAQEKVVNDTARGLYGDAFKESIDVTPELVGIMRRPSVRAAESRAVKLADEFQYPFVSTLDNLTPKYVPIRGRASEAVIDAPVIGKDPAFGGLGVNVEKRGLLDAGPAPRQEYFEVPPLESVPVRDMHTIKMGMDSLLSDHTLGIAGREAAGVRRTREGLLDMLPESYQKARQAHIELNKPIHQMDIAQELVKRVTPALSDYGALAKETGAKYASALRDGDALAKEVTGLKNATMSSMMTPDQMQTLTRIAQDIARKTNAQELGRGVGSDTAQKLAMNNIAAQSGMPRVVGGLLDLPGVGRATNWVYRDSDEKMLSMLADTLLDPKKAATLMTDQQRKWLQNNPNVRRLIEQSAIRPALAIPTTLQQAQQ